MKDYEEMIATRPAAIAGTIVHNNYLEDINDLHDPTIEDPNAAKVARKAAADALWPPQ